jgi:hypothetical protein
VKKTGVITTEKRKLSKGEQKEKRRTHMAIFNKNIKSPAAKDKEFWTEWNSPFLPKQSIIFLPGQGACPRVSSFPSN